MARIVMKFGGTSLEGPRLCAAARRIALARQAGHSVAAVLSARGGQTDALLAQAVELRPQAAGRELDQLLATGEMQSVALCALALEEMGCPARSLSGAQAGIFTDDCFGQAKILRIDTAAVRACWDAGEIAVVAGFQGVNTAGAVTTLGRGGSDTTAVALACALKADLCRIYTDVEGVYDCDPRRYPAAKKYASLSYAAMLRLIDGGAQVLARPSVELAAAYGFELEVLSSLTDAPGTRISAAAE